MSRHNGPACGGHGASAQGQGMIFLPLLTQEGRTAGWPRPKGICLAMTPNDTGTLTLTFCTFVELDPVRAHFTPEIFRIQNGRTMGRTRNAQAGVTVGNIGPGSGGFPPGPNVPQAGDETALPAIRCIPDLSPTDRRGEDLLDNGAQSDIRTLSRPVGLGFHGPFGNGARFLRMR